MKYANLMILSAALALSAVGVGCDEEDNREAGEAAGNIVEKAGEATREGADAVGDAVEDAGEAIQDAADDDPGEDLGNE